MRTSARLISSSLALAFALASARATAMPDFPPAIQTYLGLTYTLPCSVCHGTQTPGSTTATTPFAKAMIQNGLTITEVSSVDGALAALQALGTDSDCDGIHDVEQLEQGRDPSTGVYIDGSGRPKPATDIGCPGALSYGCGAQVASAPVAWEGAFAIAAALGASLLRRRPHRRPR